MKKIYLILVFTLVNIGVFGFSLPHNASIVSSSSENNTWKQNATVELTFVATKQLMNSKLLSAGYSQKHEDSSSGRNPRSISLWQNNNKKIILMVYYISISKTGISWGYENE